MFTVNETASQNGEEFGFQSGDIVQEWLWDDDVDDSVRAKIEDLTDEVKVAIMAAIAQQPGFNMANVTNVSIRKI